MKLDWISAVLPAMFIIFLNLPTKALAQQPGTPAPPSSASQADEYGAGSVGNIGALGGVGFLNNSGGSGFTYGLEGNWMLSHAFQMGVQFNSLQPSQTVLNSLSYSNTLTNIDAALRWVPSETAYGLKLGIMAGFGILSLGAPGQNSKVNLYYGVSGVYDFMFSNRWSLGPEVDYLWNSDSTGFSQLNIFASARYWF
jgi:hypothetical protein